MPRRTPTLPKLQWLTQPRSGHTRVAITRPCDLHIGGSSREATVFNISVRGLYLTLEPPLPLVGEDAQIWFRLPGEADPIECLARVTWQNPPSAILTGLGASAMGLPPGCGVEFTLIREPDEKRVQAYVAASQSGAPLAASHLTALRS